MTWEQLVRAIQDAPEDDAPRLVCADWLTERGEPRGEHITLQVQFAKIRADDPRVESMRARLAALSPAAWLAPLEQLGATGVSWGRDKMPLQLKRGFVEDATLAGRSVANVGALLRLEPLTSLVLVSGGLAPSTQAAAQPELARLSSLSLAGKYHDGQDVLLRSPHLSSLRSLSVIGMTEAMREALPHNPSRPEALLASLDDACARALARTRFLERMASLDIGSSGLTDDGVEALASAPLTALTVLDLSDSRAGARGLAALGPRLSRLESLGLGRCPLDLAAVKVLAAHATKLRRLDLSGISNTEVIDAVLASPIVASLDRLDLRYAPYSKALMIDSLWRTRMRRSDVARPLASSSNDTISAAFTGLELTPDEDW